VLLARAGVIAWQAWVGWRESPVDALISAAARRYQVDFALVKAVVWRESRFDPDAARARRGAGVMQIRAAAASEWAAAERLPSFEHGACLDPATNTLAGALVFEKLLLRYQQTTHPAPTPWPITTPDAATSSSGSMGARRRTAARSRSKSGFPARASMCGHPAPRGELPVGRQPSVPQITILSLGACRSINPTGSWRALTTIRSSMLRWLKIFRASTASASSTNTDRVAGHDVASDFDMAAPSFSSAAI